MKNFLKFRGILFFIAASYFISGCSKVSFQETQIAKKSSNEEVISPDPDQPPGGGGGDDSGPVDPNPEPIPEVQVFKQEAMGEKLDLLVVIDNSDSMMMDHSRHKIRDMFKGFLSSLSGVDYHIGFTTTDMTTPSWLNHDPGWTGRLDILQGSNLKILTPSTPNKDSLFLDTIDREEALLCRQHKWTGLCGTNYEEPLKAIKAFVDLRSSDNAGFFRDDASFVTVIVSDEDELSDGRAGATQPQDVVSHIQAAFNSTKKYRNYGVIIEPGDKACKHEQACSEFLCLGGGNYGNFVSSLAQLTSGHTASICSNDVTNDLKSIGDMARGGGLITEVTLQYQPIDGSVHVTFNPAANIQYNVVGKIVKFNVPPVAGTEITVRYEHQ
ncbi:MAG: hypothetical protein KDD34_09670 [Bdellovibrionales bacterium]|nr:hypothetical protein [Bdellovibrionales bacterium]